MDKRKAAFRQAISCLPPIRRAQLERMDRPEDIEELRFRAGQPPAAKTAVGERLLPLEAVTLAELREILSCAAQYSVHSYTDSLRHGFLTLSGGHRLGVCGTAAEEDGRILGVRGLIQSTCALHTKPRIYRSRSRAGQGRTSRNPL